MSDDRAFERTMRDWLDAGSDRTPRPAIDAVLLAVKTTPQERDLRVPWRTPAMPLPLRLAAGIAILAVIGVAAFNTLGSGPGIGSGQAPSPTTQPTPTPSPTPTRGSGELEPGAYRFSGIDPGGGIPISITLPSGWTSYEGFAVDKNYGAAAGASLVVWDIRNRYVDPCTDHTLLDPAPGAGIDELVEALASQPGIEAGPPTDVTVDGYRGKFVELTVRTDIDTCTGGGFWTWGDAGDHRYAQDTNEMDRVYVLDVDGVRLTFFARVPPRTTAADRAELEAIIGSIDILPDR